MEIDLLKQAEEFVVTYQNEIIAFCIPAGLLVFGIALIAEQRRTYNQVEKEYPLKIDQPNQGEPSRLSR